MKVGQKAEGVESALCTQGDALVKG